MESQRESSTAPRHLSSLDIAGMAAGFVLCLLACLVLSRNRLLWEDEMLGWMLLHDTSWRHMVQAWKMGADGGGFTFYLLGRGWFALFGASRISFRLFSATCFGSAFCTLWAATRRFYSAETVALAMFTAFFASPPMLSHDAEGRFYGLLVFSAAWVLAVTLWSVREPGRRHTARLCVCLFLSHALLTTSHLLGVVYSASLLASLVAIDIRAHRSRPALYASSAAAWLLLWPERTAIRASAAVGKPHFWTVPAHFSSFVGAYSEYSPFLLGLFAFLPCLLAISFWRRQQSPRTALGSALQSREPIFWVAAALFAVPVLFAAESYVATSVFINRYLIPVMLADALLLMELLCHVFERFPALLRPGWLRTGVLACYTLALLAWGFQERKFVVQRLDYAAQLRQELPPGLPVVAEDAWTFTELVGTPSASTTEYVFLLDWPWATSNAAPRLEVTQYHLMENWRKAGYFSGHILDRDAFLATHPVFLVLRPEQRGTERDGKPTIGNFLVARFQADPAYQVKRLATGMGDRPGVWEVCRGTCPDLGPR